MFRYAVNALACTAAWLPESIGRNLFGAAVTPADKLTHFE